MIIVVFADHDHRRRLLAVSSPRFRPGTSFAFSRATDKAPVAYIPAGCGAHWKPNRKLVIEPHGRFQVLLKRLFFDLCTGHGTRIDVLGGCHAHVVLKPGLDDRYGAAVPFPDELSSHGVAVVDYDSGWPREFDRLAIEISGVLGPVALAIDHVGSTSVPGLAAKDCIDIQVRVDEVDHDLIVPLMSELGFRCRPEPWNRMEFSAGVECVKLVFAPPVGARSCNVHVRRHDGPNARYALLFRDFLRADERARRGWGAFKRRLAQSVPDLLDYGQIKVPATEVLMAGAERWAEHTGWHCPPLR